MTRPSKKNALVEGTIYAIGNSGFCTCTDSLCRLTRAPRINGRPQRNARHAHRPRGCGNPFAGIYRLCKFLFVNDVLFLEFVFVIELGTKKFCQSGGGLPRHCVPRKVRCYYSLIQIGFQRTVTIASEAKQSVGKIGAILGYHDTPSKVAILSFVGRRYLEIGSQKLIRRTQKNIKRQTSNAEKPKIYDFIVLGASSKSYEN